MIAALFIMDCAQKNDFITSSSAGSQIIQSQTTQHCDWAFYELLDLCTSRRTHWSNEQQCASDHQTWSIRQLVRRCQCKMLQAVNLKSLWMRMVLFNLNNRFHSNSSKKPRLTWLFYCVSIKKTLIRLISFSVLIAISDNGYYLISTKFSIW